MQRAPTPPRRRTPLPRALTRARLGAAGLAALVTASCGASINALYEGDVRFEHCMALDMQDHVKPTIRKACWEEWSKFYTFGQTRDRVEYARVRIKQLQGTIESREPDLADDEAPVSPSVPEPTTALEPPPMMLVLDAGTRASDADASSDPPAAEPPAPPGAACTKECEYRWKECFGACLKPICERTCATIYKQCARKCL